MITVEKFRETMKKISDRVAGEKVLLEKNNIPVAGLGRNEGIDIIQNKCDEDLFRLLVMGIFSSGKSAFINVLLGEKILPENALPTTALITEIYYGKEKRVVMYPKAGGGWAGGDEPFDIEPTLEEIKKYCTINNKNGLNTKEANVVSSVFEKMVVYWPLDILEGGVCIIDSPGIDDPYQNDYIVKEYIPKADAILYCMNSMHAFSNTDRNTLNDVMNRGFEPIIVNTFFDVVSQTMDDTEKQEFIETTYSQYYSTYTKREYCHYVNSLLGMVGKKSSSKDALIESGYDGLESFISTYLTDCKGKEKIASVTASLSGFNDKVKKSIISIDENLSVDDGVFATRVEEAEKEVADAEKRGNLLIKEFNIKVKEAKERVLPLVPSLYDSIYNELSLDDFEPATNFSVWHPQESPKMIANECTNEIKRRNKQITEKWNDEQFEPMVSAEFTAISKDIKDEIDRFSSSIVSANITMKIDLKNPNVTPSNVTRAASVIYAMMTGDWLSAILGGTLGAGAALASLGRTMLCAAASGFILGIVSCFTPVGIGALVVATLGAIVLGPTWTVIKAKDTIKKKCLKSSLKEMKKNKEKIIADATVQCEKIFDDACATFENAINDDIDEIRKNIKLAEDERAAHAAKAVERKAELKEVLDHIEETDVIIAEIKSENKIA